MRRNDWIIDVLTDLRAFAATNGMPDLARATADLAIVAEAEIARAASAAAPARPAEAHRARVTD